MENGAEFSGEWTKNGEGVLPRVALVDDNVEAQFQGEFELRGEEAELFGSLGLPGCEGGGFRGRLGVSVIIDPDFADGADLRFEREGAKGGKDVFG